MMFFTKADKEDFETNKEIFEAFGTQIEYCGMAGF